MSGSIKPIKKNQHFVADSQMKSFTSVEAQKHSWIWDTNKDFSEAFLDKHHDYVLHDVAHQIKALLLYPVNCCCEGGCRCQTNRDKIVLSLNMDLMNRVQGERISPKKLQAMRMLFKIPDDSFFKANYAQSYPVWLIDKQFHEDDRNKNFKIVEHLVWGLLRLAKTCEVSPFGESRASLNEAVEMIVGGTPLKSKSNKTANDPPLCGEKAYGIQLNAYKSVCHFVAAYKHLEGKDPTFSLSQPEHIEKFLCLSHWFRAKLLTLKTPNVKGKFMFSEESLLPLPEWISSNDIHISIDLYEDKLQKLIATLQKVA